MKFDYIQYLLYMIEQNVEEHDYNVNEDFYKGNLAVLKTVLGDDININFMDVTVCEDKDGDKYLYVKPSGYIARMQNIDITSLSIHFGGQIIINGNFNGYYNDNKIKICIYDKEAYASIVINKEVNESVKRGIYYISTHEFEPRNFDYCPKISFFDGEVLNRLKSNFPEEELYDCISYVPRVLNKIGFLPDYEHFSYLEKNLDRKMKPKMYNDTISDGSIEKFSKWIGEVIKKEEEIYKK